MPAQAGPPTSQSDRPSYCINYTSLYQQSKLVSQEKATFGYLFTCSKEVNKNRGTVDVLKDRGLPSTPKNIYSTDRSYEKECGCQPYAAIK